MTFYKSGAACGYFIEFFSGFAWLVAGILSRLLYHVAPTDRFTYTSATLVLIGIALLAALVPARRASRTDPVAVLR